MLPFFFLSLFLSFFPSLETVSFVDCSFGIQPWDSGIPSLARSIVAYETRERGVSLSPSLSTNRRRDTRFSEWVEESLQRSCELSRRCARVRRELVLCIVQNTRNNLWTGHDDWNIYSARYARCTLYDGIFVAASVPATARSGITVPYFKHDPLRWLGKETGMIPERAIVIHVAKKREIIQSSSLFVWLFVRLGFDPRVSLSLASSNQLSRIIYFLSNHVWIKLWKAFSKVRSYIEYLFLTKEWSGCAKWDGCFASVSRTSFGPSTTDSVDLISAIYRSSPPTRSNLSHLLYRDPRGNNSNITR